MVAVLHGWEQPSSVVHVVRRLARGSARILCNCVLANQDPASAGPSPLAILVVLRRRVVLPHGGSNSETVSLVALHDLREDAVGPRLSIDGPSWA